MTAVPEKTLFEQMGGASALRPVTDDFVTRCLADTMIGFFFRDADPETLKLMEYQFSARGLGAEIAYAGRPVASVHARFKINGGQFARRMQILRETCDDHGVAPHIRDAWLAHQDSLRQLVTPQPAGECMPRRASGPLVEHVPAADDGKAP